MVGWKGLAIICALLLATTAAHAEEASDEQRLAALASHMLNLTGSNDFAMECGPADVVLPLTPQAKPLQGKYYCIMNLSGNTVFGTFVSPEPAGREAEIDAWNDTAYRQQVRTINKAGCRSAGSTFQLCSSDTVRTMVGGRSSNLNVYAYDSAASIGGTGMLYLIASEQPLDALTGKSTVLGRIGDFFRGLFGWL